MRYTIYESINAAVFRYFILDNVTFYRTSHYKSFNEMKYLDFTNKLYPGREFTGYNISYKFDSFEEFKEQYPEEFI